MSMPTGDFRGAGPLAAEWILTPGRHVSPDERPDTRWTEHADAPDAIALSEVGTRGAWIRVGEDDAVVAPDVSL
jgi:hypothetical protein